MHLQYSSTKNQFFEFLVVMCCITFNMDILLSLLILKTCIIKIPKDSLFILLLLNACLHHGIPC